LVSRGDIMTAQEHEDEPAGTDPVVDEAEQERGRKAYSAWWRSKLLSAARAGSFPVDQDGRTVIPDWLAALLELPQEEANRRVLSPDYPGTDRATNGPQG
jgi:hypothetical protein